ASGDYSVLFGIESKLTQDSTFMVDMPHVRIGNEADGFELPTTDGTSGQVMTTDGAGQVSWSEPPTGGSGWTLTSDVVHLTDEGDIVRVGTYSGGAKLNISNTGGGELDPLTGLGVWTEDSGDNPITSGYFSAVGTSGAATGVRAIGTAGTSDTVYGLTSFSTNTGTGVGVGIYGETEFAGDGNKIGVLGRGAGAGPGNNYGGHFSTAGGMSNTGTKYGVYGLANNLTSSSAYGVYGEAYNPNDGYVYGGVFTTSGSGTGPRIGVLAQGLADNSVNTVGISATAQNDGSGVVYGGKFRAEGFGTGDKRAIYGFSHADGTEDGYGLDIYSINNGSGTNYGVYAISEGTSTGSSYGIYTEANSYTAGTNVYGANHIAKGTTIGGVYGSVSYAYGNGSISTVGVTGFAADSGSGSANAGFFTVSSAGSGVHYGVQAYEAPGGSGAAIYANGDFAASGTKSAVMRTSRGTTLMYAVESAEVWFEDFGEGRLINGQAHIELDPLFLEMVTINSNQPMKVFIQLNDDCNGTYVKTSLTGFEVFELNQGVSEASFTYRVVAKRKGYESERMRTAEIGHDDPNLYPERAEEILEKMQAPSRTE
ncbi:MAG: hypothetical protein ACYS67_20370, partial [Planctomycetota bacterium]